MIAVSDTSPINYLVQIGEGDLLGLLFDYITIPSAVVNELTAVGAPQEVRAFTLSRPAWLKTQGAPEGPERLPGLGPGETGAISLAVATKPDFVLLDDRRARQAAEQLGIPEEVVTALEHRGSRRFPSSP